MEEEAATSKPLSLQQTAQRLAELAAYLRDLARQPLPDFVQEASEEHCAAVVHPGTDAAEDR